MQKIQNEIIAKKIKRGFEIKYIDKILKEKTTRRREWCAFTMPHAGFPLNHTATNS